MLKRKNLQSICNFEPFPKKVKYFGNPFETSFENTLKRKLSWKDLTVKNLLSSINSIDYDYKMNKICKSMQDTSVNEKNKKNENTEIKSEFYFLYHF
jgi:hypothetical protein